MEAIKHIYYRVYQKAFDIGARFLYWRKPITITGEGSIVKAPELFAKHGIKKVIIVTGRTVGKTIAPIAKEALEKAGIENKQLELIQLVECGQWMLHFRDIVNTIEYSG